MKHRRGGLRAGVAFHAITEKFMAGFGCAVPEAACSTRIQTESGVRCEGFGLRGACAREIVLFSSAASVNESSALQCAQSGPAAAGSIAREPNSRLTVMATKRERWCRRRCATSGEPQFDHGTPPMTVSPPRAARVSVSCCASSMIGRSWRIIQHHNGKDRSNGPYHPMTGGDRTVEHIGLR